MKQLYEVSFQVAGPLRRMFRVEADSEEQAIWIAKKLLSKGKRTESPPEIHEES
jgi:hypothetical protein